MNIQVDEKESLVQTKTVPEITVLAASHTLTIPEIGSFSAEMCAALEFEARRTGLTISGPWIFVSHNVPQDETTTFPLAICLPVESLDEYEGEFESVTLPPFGCTWIEYRGRLTGIFEGGYAPLLNDILQNQAALTGEIREVYHVWTTPDADENHVEIQIGLAGEPVS